jgi:hypothetical protein
MLNFPDGAFNGRPLCKPFLWLLVVTDTVCPWGQVIFSGRPLSAGLSSKSAKLNLPVLGSRPRMPLGICSTWHCSSRRWHYLLLQRANATFWRFCSGWCFHLSYGGGGRGAISIVDSVHCAANGNTNDRLLQGWLGSFPPVFQRPKLIFVSRW